VGAAPRTWFTAGSSGNLVRLCVRLCVCVCVCVLGGGGMFCASCFCVIEGQGVDACVCVCVYGCRDLVCVRVRVCGVRVCGV
jgi:hypothetical protein